MSDKKKNIDEISAVGNVVGFGGPLKVKSKDFFKTRRKRKSKNASAPFGPAGYGVVFPNKKGPKKGKEDKPFKKGKAVSSETKSERMLREAVRNLIFLNRVKYHEEQVLREMQEQKLRGIIRKLISEADDSSKVNYSSTGETAGAAFMKKISVTFDEYAALVSTQRQRDEFKKIYLTGIKSYLDALDQQYYILNPDENPNAAQNAPVPQAPEQKNTAVKNVAPPNNKLQEAAPSPINSTKVNPMSGMDNKNLVAQATATAMQIVGASNKTGHGAAENALNRDLPQIDPLYNNLTFEQFAVTDSKGNSRNTSDRNDFRIMLIGDSKSNGIGNIANEFAKIDIAKQTNDSPHKNDPSKTPALEPKPLPGNEQVTAPATAPAAGGLPPPVGGEEETAALETGTEEETV